MEYSQRIGPSQWSKLYEYLKPFPRIHTNNEQKTRQFVEAVFQVLRAHACAAEAVKKSMAGRKIRPQADHGAVSNAHLSYERALVENFHHFVKYSEEDGFKVFCAIKQMRRSLKKYMAKKTEDIQAVIWDLDNTLYRLDRALMRSFDMALARAVLDKNVPLTLHEAMRMARISYEETGDPTQVFADKYHLDSEDLHHSFHRYVDERIIVRSEKMRGLFRQSPLTHRLITQGSKGWAKRVIRHLGLTKWFPENHILAFEDYDFQHKSQSRLPFETALNNIDLSIHNIAVIEDKMENLKIPHEMGFLTVYVHHGRQPDDLPPYVDIPSDNAIHVLQHILKQDTMAPVA